MGAIGTHRYSYYLLLTRCSIVQPPLTVVMLHTLSTIHALAPGDNGSSPQIADKLIRLRPIDSPSSSICRPRAGDEHNRGQCGYNDSTSDILQFSTYSI